MQQHYKSLAFPSDKVLELRSLTDMVSYHCFHNLFVSLVQYDLLEGILSKDDILKFVDSEEF
jgi:hypothetical protein